MLNALTIDLEDWYHICGLTPPIKFEDWPNYETRIVENTKKILEILSTKNIKATFFILGYIAQHHPDLIKSIDSLGHEIASHGFRHELVYNQTPEEFTRDLTQSIKILEDLTGKRILGYRAPSFSITPATFWTLDILVSSGIKYDCSLFPIRHPRYGLPKAPIFPYRVIKNLVEFPPSVIKILGKNIPFSGGPAFRLLPNWFIKQSVKKINQLNQPAQIYLHPWEVDVGQPKLNIPLSRRLPHYINLKYTISKLHFILDNFEFAPVKEVLHIEG